MKRLPEGRTSTPPGEVLLEEFVEPLGLTARDLAAQIGAPSGEVEGLLSEDLKALPFAKRIGIG